MLNFTRKLRSFLEIIGVVVTISSACASSSDLPDISDYKRPLLIAGVAVVAGAAYYLGTTPDVSPAMTAMPRDLELFLNASYVPKHFNFFVNSTSLYQVAVEVPATVGNWSSKLTGWIADCYNPLAYATFDASQRCLVRCYSTLNTIGRTSRECLAYVECFSNGTDVLSCYRYWDSWYASVKSIYNASGDNFALPNATNGLLAWLQYEHPNQTFHWYTRFSSHLRDGINSWKKAPLTFWGL